MQNSSLAELLAPAGDFETALAAFAAGADAVYCGLADFSARAFAKNFTFEELTRLVAYAHAHHRKVYVTFNTLVDEDDLEKAASSLSRLAEIGPDALIVQDLGLARLCRRHYPELTLHASTQLVAHNLEGVLSLGALGFTRVVLARELSLAEIEAIQKRCGSVELEVFIHGALCYSLSGLCLFGAMTRGRSGNRGTCPYCCRLSHTDESGASAYPFSMKDLRLGPDARRLVSAGVASLKIEGRMKSPLYVASVTAYYRAILDGTRPRVSLADLETVFSRRTTHLRFDGSHEDVIDTDSLGHLGTPIGTVKRVTKDREGRAWLRFHTLRALERHDGLQFDTMVDGKHLGLGIAEMRPAISRANVFEVAAGTDVEIAIPDSFPIKPGETIYCSMSNAVKRAFSIPPYRPSDYPAGCAVDVVLTLTPTELKAEAKTPHFQATATAAGDFAAAKNPDKTFAAVEKAFSKLGETGYRLGSLSLVDPNRLFAPMSLLNDLRRDLVEALNESAAKTRAARLNVALADDETPAAVEAAAPARRLKLRVGQPVPAGDWDEVIVAIDETTESPSLAPYGDAAAVRLALPVYTSESSFARLRLTVKRLVRAGYVKWEAADLATLRLLRTLNLVDITADWSLYAFNSRALAALAELGVKRFVASPENVRENLVYLAESGYSFEMLTQQSTPLFISLHRPASLTPEGLAIYPRGDLWVTTARNPRTFSAPSGASVRVDLSWDPPLDASSEGT